MNELNMKTKLFLKYVFMYNKILFVLVEVSKLIEQKLKVLEMGVRKHLLVVY